MISSSKLFIFSIFFICIFNGALCMFGNSYWHMHCSKLVEPSDPSRECKWGTELNICNKTSCLKGPNEFCETNEMGVLGVGKHCNPNLRCCGICTGCIGNICSTEICDTNSIAAKRASPSKPLWFTDYYRQREEEKRRLQLIQQQQHQYQHQQLNENQRQQLMPSLKDFINFKSSIDRYPNYPLNNNFEYSTNNDD